MVKSLNLRLLNRVLPQQKFSQLRNAWVVKNAFHIPPTPPHLEQRSPLDKPLFLKFEAPDCTERRKMPFAKIILIKSIEGIGKAGEIVEVKSHMVREFYLPSGSAVYASPYNIEKYRKLIESNEEKSHEPHVKLGISKNLYDLSILLNSKAIPTWVALENKWTLQKWHISVALRQSDIIVQTNQIVLSPDTVTGPNMRLQNSLFRFYIIAKNRVILPAYGRYQHITTKTYRQMLTPTLPDPTKIDHQDLNYSNLIEEDMFIIEQDQQDLSKMADTEIWQLMQEKMILKKQEMEKNPVKISKREQAALDAEVKRLRDKEVHLLRCRSFDLPLPAEPWSAEDLAIAQQRAKRNRYWDDDLHVWYEPLGKL